MMKRSLSPAGKRVASKKTLITSDEECIPEHSYYYENGIVAPYLGLRKVTPYYFKYKTYVKSRWEGRTAIDIFSTEFRDKPAEYYKKAIKEGLIKVNDELIDESYRVKMNDFISHKIHRHEPPVSAEKIEKVYEKDDILVVSKPASIPAHPSGRYRFNTITEIVKNEYGYDQLANINRLDRLTSGVMILAASTKAAEALHKKMRDKQISKEYVCKVKGEFPSYQITCSEPIKCVNFKLGLCSVSPDGKESCTIFNRLAFDGTFSIIQCIPITGRTHQIRVHLQYLGFPIANDKLYSWDGKGGLNNEQLERISNDLLQKLKEGDLEATGPVENENNQMICYDCEYPLPDPSPSEMCIWLHAYKYKIDDLTFEVPYPSWATDIINKCPI